MELKIYNSKESVEKQDLVPEKAEKDFVPRKRIVVKDKKTKRNFFENFKNLFTSKDPISKKKRKEVYKVTLFVFFCLMALSAIFSYLYIVKPILNIRKSLNIIEATSQNILKDLGNKNISSLDSNVNIIKTELSKTKEELDSFYFLNNISFTKGYYNNLKIGQGIINKTESLIETKYPKLKELLVASGFSVEALEQEISSDLDDNALKLILNNVPGFIELYETTEPEILSIFEDANSINPSFIPNVSGLKNKFEKFNKFSISYDEKSAQALEFLKFAPELLGSNKKTTYLLVLQNETELRSSGGILSAYGSMSIENGEIMDIKISDMWNLENYVRSDVGVSAGPIDFNYFTEYPPHINPYFGYYQNIYGQDFLMNSFDFSCGSTTLRAQDVNLYPDINWSMNLLKDYYYWANIYDKERFPDYDHILVINQTFVENILNLAGPLEVEGFGTVTAESLMDFVKKETDRPELIFDADRKAIIGRIADSLKEKFFALDSDKISDAIQILIKSFYAKDIALNTFTNGELQNFFDKYSMSGKTEKNFSGDYFSLSEAQNCSLKLNRWVRDEVTQNIEISDSGFISKNINVKWTQPQIYNPAIDNQYSGSIGFSYRSWVRLFVPKESQILGSDGASKYSPDYAALEGFEEYKPITYYDDQEQKEVSDNVIEFDHRRFGESDPIRGTDLNVIYNLPASLSYKESEGYRMLIQKHPGKSWGEKYNINISYRGQTYSTNFVLDQDKVLYFKDGEFRLENYAVGLDWVLELVN